VELSFSTPPAWFFTSYAVLQFLTALCVFIVCFYILNLRTIGYRPTFRWVFREFLFFLASLGIEKVFAGIVVLIRIDGNPALNNVVSLAKLTTDALFLITSVLVVRIVMKEVPKWVWAFRQITSEQADDERQAWALREPQLPPSKL
jgi:hypothetical protein